MEFFQMPAREPARTGEQARTVAINLVASGEVCLELTGRSHRDQATGPQVSRVAHQESFKWSHVGHRRPAMRVTDAPC